MRAVVRTFVGVDLSGPTNVADTSLAVFDPSDRGIWLRELHQGATDDFLFTEIDALEGPLAVGLDAPLSYEPGGGQRARDARLREVVVAAGLPPGSVMAPTMTRMAFLALRGIAVARLLASTRPMPSVVEVHPGAAFALRGAPIDAVLGMKSSARDRRVLLDWLVAQGVDGLDGLEASDHDLAAIAAALAVWHWTAGEPAFWEPPAPPHHPYGLLA